MADFDVTDRKQLEAWLRTQPREVAVLIATRSALRVFPTLAPLMNDGRSRRARARDIVLPILRAIFAASVSGTWQTHAVELRAASYAAAAAAADAASNADDAAAAAYAASYAAATAADASYAAATDAVATYISRAADAAAFTADAAADAAAVAAHVAAHVAAAAAALESDVDAIVGGLPPARAPLWSDGRPPGWAAEGWDRLKLHLLALNEDWEVWTDWYDARLRGDPANEALEVARVLIPDEVWKQGPKVVNAEIKRLIEEHSPSREPPGEDEADAASDTEPSPTPGPYTITLRGERLEAEPTLGEPTEPTVAEGMLEALRRDAEDALEALVENLADPVLSKALERLREDLDCSAAEVPIGRLQVALRRMEGLAAAYGDSAREADRTVHGLVAGLAEGLRDFTALYPAIQDMEAGRAALGVIGDADTASLLQSIQQIAAVAGDSPAAGNSVVQAITDGEEEIAAFTAMIDDPRADVVARAAAIKERSALIGLRLLTVWNLGAITLKWLKDELGPVGSKSWKEAKDGIPRGVGKLAEDGVYSLGKIALLFLAVKLAGPFAPLAFVLPAFKAMKKRLDEIEKAAGDDNEG